MSWRFPHLTPKWHSKCLAWGSLRWCYGATSWPHAHGGPSQGASSGTPRGRPGPGQPWWPTQKYRSLWGFAEMESQPPAPGTDTDYMLNEGENCWCIQDIRFRIKYSPSFKFPIWIYYDIKNLCCWQHLTWLNKHLLNISKFKILNSIYINNWNLFTLVWYILK